jgi:hypothetical protein
MLSGSFLFQTIFGFWHGNFLWLALKYWSWKKPKKHYENTLGKKEIVERRHMHITNTPSLWVKGNVDIYILSPYGTFWIWTITRTITMSCYHSGICQLLYFLFLVEKSLANRNCLLARVFVLHWLVREGIVFHKSWPKVIEGRESEFEFSFN